MNAEETRGNSNKGAETRSGDVVDPLAGTPGQWVPIADAAARLACSQRTVWRLISRGKLRRRGVGGRAEVYVPDGMPPVGTPATALAPANPATSDNSQALSVAIVDELKRRDQDQAATIVAQAEQIGRLQAEAEQLRAELEQARRRRWWFW